MLSLPEAAAALGVSLSTLRRLLASGAIPYTRLSPRRIGIDPAAITRYVKEGGWQSVAAASAGQSSFNRAESAYFAA